MIPIAVPARPISGAHHTGARNSANVSTAKNAVTNGQNDGGGMCIGSSGPCAAATTFSASVHSGSRLCTVGTVAKLYSAGGDVVAHSSVAPPHGFEPAAFPRFSDQMRLMASVTIANAWIAPPTVEIMFNVPTFSSDEYVKMRRGMPSKPVQCIGMNVRLNPMKNSQKNTLPSCSFIILPVTLGNQ